jgi:poly-gamma-glutamate capsule biosynthesis protein CapA/YwtB (metallophosphatase superfamily)
VRPLRLVVPTAAICAVVGAAVLSGRDASKAPDVLRSLDSVAARMQQATRLGSGKPVVFAFGGDVHAEGSAATRLAASPTGMLDAVEPVFSRADIAVVNLETAVTSRGTPAPAKEYTFRAPASIFGALRAGGIDVASMANNHGLDYGETGLRDSLAAARRYDFPVIGIGLDGARAYAPYRTKVKGQRVAILGATQVLDDHLISAWTAGPGKPGLASAKEVPRLLQEVRKARRTADTVVVFLHWGVELEACPTTDQRTLARALVDAGADIVVGGHAHRLLGTGRMGKAVVSYGLGNFIWYGTSELSTQTGVLLVTATGRRIDGYRWEPARIVDGVPRPLTGAERRGEIAEWRSLRSCTGLKP